MSTHGPAWVWQQQARAPDRPLPSQPTAEGSGDGTAGATVTPQAVGVPCRVHKCTPCLHAWLAAGLGLREGQTVAAASGKRALGTTRARGPPHNA